MLSGVLIKFVISAFDQVPGDPVLVVPLILLFLVVRLASPAWAVILILFTGIALVFALGRAGPLPESLAFSRFEFVTPAFSLTGLIGVAVPLYLVTMASQNLPGFAVLKTAGYTPPTAPVLAVTGAASLVSAPFGALTTNLAAITAAMCCGPDTYPDAKQRWKTGPIYGLYYALLAAVGASLVALFAVLPLSLIIVIAGLALLAPLIGAVGVALKEEGTRAAAVLTMCVTASDLSIAGVGSAFWGLSAGLLVLGPVGPGGAGQTQPMTDVAEIPVLDLAPLWAGANNTDLARDFALAYGETGFAYVINHGIDPALTDAIFEASRRFHALPEAAKHVVALDRNHRGYIAIDTSTDVNSDLAEVTRPNQSASFMMMREDAAELPGVYLSGPNLWPDLAGFRETCEAYAAALSGLAQRLMALALDAIGVTDRGILTAFDTPTFWLRLLHYPPQPAQAPDDLYGSAPHRDFGCLTLLAQDDIGGLQVRTRRATGLMHRRGTEPWS